MQRDNARTAAFRRGLTFAAAVIATVACAQPAAAETTSCPAESSLCGVVFNDANSNQTQEDGEANIGGPNVFVIAVSSGGNVTTAETSCDVNVPESCGYYSLLLPSGSYVVCVVESFQASTCDGHLEKQDVTITAGEPGVPQDIGKPGAPVVLSGPGTGTPGYWKNHSWPVPTLKVGGVVMTRAEILKFMGKVAGDKTLTIFASYVSARLNVIVGNNDSCIKDAIAAADAWLAEHPVGSKVFGSDYAWSGDNQGESYHILMDRYNNGLLPCAVHRN